MLKVAFPLLGRGGWTGGYNYLKNTLQLIQSRLSDQMEAYVFLSPIEHERYGAELSALTCGRLIVDPAIAVVGRGKSLLKALATGKDHRLENLLLAVGIDAAFENASFYGAGFAIPVISWMPDFQHRYMPHMFAAANRLRRDIGFKIQIAAGRTIMVSSETAKQDLERFYPASIGKSHVVRFAIDLDPEPYLARAEEMRATYGLPRRFFFLPNQFWQHKNHGIVVAALAKLKAEGGLDALPPVILTGHSSDPRHPTHFSALMRDADEVGVGSHFRYLGLIPYDHVLSLNAACDALINPSLFEGWSTPIEEAKALGTPLILSDLAIHREQATEAAFFDPRSSNAFAAAFSAFAREPSPEPPELSALRAEQDARLREHARALLRAVASAAASKSFRHTQSRR